MNAPIKDAFDCFSRKPMRGHFVLGFPSALLSLSQEKSSGVEIDLMGELEIMRQFLEQLQQSRRKTEISPATLERDLNTQLYQLSYQANRPEAGHL